MKAGTGNAHFASALSSTDSPEASIDGADPAAVLMFRLFRQIDAESVSPPGAVNSTSSICPSLMPPSSFYMTAFCT